MTEACLSVGLLLGSHLTITCLFDEGNLFLTSCYQHQHLSCEITTGKRVLSEERQWLQVGHVGVEQYIGNLSLCEFFRETGCLFESGRYDDDTVDLSCQELTDHLCEGGSIETLIIDELQRDTEITTELATGLGTFFDLVPIGILFVLGQHHIEGIGLIVGECRGVHIRTIIQFFKSLIDFL